MVVGGSNTEGLTDDVELISPTPNEECSKAVMRISGTKGLVHCMDPQKFGFPPGGMLKSSKSR